MQTVSPDTRDLWFLFLAGLATIAGAWGFQIFGDLAPCPLCLYGRWPYYAGLPLTLIAIFAAGRNPALSRMATGLVIVCFLGSFVFAAYHAGVEWKFWPGPDTCATGTGAPTDSGGLLNQMRSTRVVPCDEAAWRLFGISLAGYNALISLGLAQIAIKSLRGRNDHGSISISQ